MLQTFTTRNQAFLQRRRLAKSIRQFKPFAPMQVIAVRLLTKLINSSLRCRVDISEKIKPHEWEKLPWRWIVERTFAWMNAARRLAKEFEISVSIEEAMIIIACAAVLLRRL